MYTKRNLVAVIWSVVIQLLGIDSMCKLTIALILSGAIKPSGIDSVCILSVVLDVYTNHNLIAVIWSVVRQLFGIDPMCEPVVAVILTAVKNRWVLTQYVY